MPALNISIAFCLLVSMAGAWALRSVEWISVTGFVAAALVVWALLRRPAVHRLIPPSPMAHRLFIVAYACIPLFFAIAMLAAASGAHGFAAAMFAGLVLVPVPVLLLAGFALLLRASIQRLNPS